MIEINELIFYTQGVVGYIMKIEHLPEKINKLKIEKKAKPCNFQFKIDKENLVFYGETFIDGQLSEIRSESRNPEISSYRFENDIIYSSHLSNDNRLLYL